jgi:hypothetical protein
MGRKGLVRFTIRTVELNNPRREELGICLRGFKFGVLIIVVQIRLEQAVLFRGIESDGLKGLSVW